MIDIKRLEWDRGYWDEVAPEGANRYYDRPHYQCFLKQSSLDHLYHLSSGEWHPIPRYAIQSHLNSSFPRPEPRQVEWDGSGLPPVGIECELSSMIRSVFEDHEIIAGVPEGTIVQINGTANFGNGEVRIFSGVLNGQWFNGYHKACAFRPIRTKQQREREELTEILQNGRLTLMSDQLADLILRSGWSKNDG